MGKVDVVRLQPSFTMPILEECTIQLLINSYRFLADRRPYVCQILVDTLKVVASFVVRLIPVIWFCLRLPGTVIGDGLGGRVKN